MAEEQAVQNTESASTTEGTTIAGDASLISLKAGEKDSAVAAGSNTESATDGEGNVKEATAGDSQEGGDAEASEEDGGTQTPVEYEFKTPEGFEEMNTEAIEQFIPLAKELGLSNDQGQQLVNHYADQLLHQQKAMTEGWAKQIEEHQTNVLADREIGGELGSDSFKAKQKIIRTALNDLPDSAFKKAVLNGGAIDVNDPGLIRVLYRYGKLISESSFREGVPRVRSKVPGQLQYESSDHANP